MHCKRSVHGPYPVVFRERVRMLSIWSAVFEAMEAETANPGAWLKLCLGWPREEFRFNNPICEKRTIKIKILGFNSYTFVITKSSFLQKSRIFSLGSPTFQAEVPWDPCLYLLGSVFSGNWCCSWYSEDMVTQFGHTFYTFWGHWAGTLWILVPLEITRYSF